MGYMVHHAIIVTSWSDEAIEAAHQKAVEVFGNSVTAVLPKAVNSYRTFLIGPDGSKDGWDESYLGDTRRNAFVAWLNTQRYDDGSCNLDWAEVQYGDDDGNDYVVRTEADHPLSSDGTKMEP